MRTEVDASAARIKKKKRSSEHSKRHDRPAEDGGGEWKQFTSPDGHPYYYNAVTKESRWELPKEEEEPPPARSKHRRPKGSSKQVVLEQEAPLSEAADEPQPKKEKKKRPESRRSAAEEPVPVRKSKNAMFQKLQASLEGRLNPPVMGRPPPMLNIRREGEVEHAGGAAAQEEEQYEAETAGMSAAERLRFLRKKRQENMMAKRESITGDDFMAEVANNMKKKGATLKSKEKERDGGDKAMTWKEQEQAEEERKRQQMQAEMEAKEQEVARKEREEQAAREREQRREQERAEQIALEERREQEQRQRQEEERIEKEEKKKKKEQKKQKNVVDLEERDSEHDTLAGSEQDPTAQDTRATTDNVSTGGRDEEVSDASSPERVGHRKRSKSRGSKHGSSTRSLKFENTKEAVSTKDDHSPAEDGHGTLSNVAPDTLHEEKLRAREERRARKLKEKELAGSKLTEPATSESLRRKSVSSTGDLTEDSSTRTSSSAEAEEEARAIEKQLRRERRRVAKLEAALAAQSLGGDPNNVQHEQSQGGQYPTSSNGSAPGSAQMGSYPMGGPPLSGGMYAPYPYMMMPPPPPPPPTPYGYYYPYMQPPPMMPTPMYSPGVAGVPPVYQLMPQTPPPSSDGMATPSAMVPYSAESSLESAYGMPFGSMYGQQSAPELSRCDCCHGIGVGLVEKNGVCAHCNRLRLAFIVDSAQMRQRCSVCGGWGFQLLQANGMCEHCSRQTSQKSAEKVIAEARRRGSVATPLAARAPQRRGNPPKNDALDDVDWDKSSSDESDWDD